jgi:hypothetical protein
VPITTGCRPSENCLPGAGRFESFALRGTGVKIYRQAEQTRLHITKPPSPVTAHSVASRTSRERSDSEDQGEHHAGNSEMV